MMACCDGKKVRQSCQMQRVVVCSESLSPDVRRQQSGLRVECPRLPPCFTALQEYELMKRAAHLMLTSEVALEAVDPLLLMALL